MWYVGTKTDTGYKFESSKVCGAESVKAVAID